MKRSFKPEFISVRKFITTIWMVILVSTSHYVCAQKYRELLTFFGPYNDTTTGFDQFINLNKTHGIREGRLAELQFKIAHNSKEDQYIRTSLHIRATIGRGAVAFETKQFIGIDDLNNSGYFKRCNEVVEAGDRIVVSIDETQEYFVLPIIKFENLRIRDVLRIAAYDNVYFGNTVIELEYINAPDQLSFLDSTLFVNGRFKPRGFIRLNNCKFARASRFHRLEVAVLKNIDFGEFTIVNGQDAQLGFDSCTFEQLNLRNLPGRSRAYCEFIISEY